MEKEEWVKFYDREMESLRSANIELSKGNTENLYKVSKLQIENETLKHKFEEINMLLEQSQNDYLLRKKQISGLETEIKAVRETFGEAAAYIELLEKEVERINQ